MKNYTFLFFKRLTADSRCLFISLDKIRETEMIMSSVGTTCLAEGTNHYKTYGGRQAKYKKKHSRKGKLLSEKNLCTPIYRKKYSCYGLKKINTKNLLTKKIPGAQKFPNPNPPHNFLMVRP